jgi:hypothetical protein
MGLIEFMDSLLPCIPARFPEVLGAVVEHHFEEKEAG